LIHLSPRKQQEDIRISRAYSEFTVTNLECCRYYIILYV